jgi:hypothetical protein
VPVAVNDLESEPAHEHGLAVDTVVPADAEVSQLLDARHEFFLDEVLEGHRRG